MFIARDLLPPRPPSSEAHRKNKAEAIRRIIGVLAKGNICLQRGLFMTAGDIEELRKKVIGYEF